MKSTKKKCNPPPISRKKQQSGLMGLLFLGVFLVGFSSCDDGENDPQNPVTEQDRIFAVEAAYSNLAEMEMGQLAIEKSSDESIRDFGLMMVTDHTNAQNQLAAIAEKENLDLPDTLKAEHQTIYDQLYALEGEPFDSAYISSQIEAHQQAQQIFQKQLEQGSHGQFLDFASNTLAHINTHLERAMELKEEVVSEE